MSTKELRSNEDALELLNHGESTIRECGVGVFSDMRNIFGSSLPPGVVAGWWDFRSANGLCLQDVDKPDEMKRPKMQARCRAEVTKLRNCHEPSERNEQVGWAVNIREWVFGCAGFPSVNLNAIFVLALMHRLRIINYMEVQVEMRKNAIMLDQGYFVRLFGSAN